MFPSTTRWIRLVAVAAVASGIAVPTNGRAQEPATLTLEQAIELARRNNPDYLSQKNDEGAAEWAVRSAYGSLLPSASASFGMQYQAKGEPQLGIFSGSDLGLSGGQSYYYSDYSLGLNYQIGGSTLFQVSQEKANRTATRARTAAARSNLESQVTSQYIFVLGAKDAVDLAQTELDRADENLKLAQARVEVGDAIELEAKQAEVERGRAEVDLIKAKNDLESSKLNLVQLLGVQIDRDVTLTTQLEVFEPRWDAPDLVARAMARNPTLNANRAAEQASGASVRMARSAYFPTLNMNVGWSGYTREAGNADLLVAQAEAGAQNNFQSCGVYNQINDRLTSPIPGFPLDCSSLTLTDAQRQQIVENNNVFPFNFTRQPMTAQLRLSLPIFNGFSRESRVQEARAAADDATYRVRATELKLRTDITNALNSLKTAYTSVGLEERNATLAAEQLDLARERYRLGMTSFVDLIDAETIKARADRAYLQARYTFFESYAALENAVGEPLNRQGESR